MDPIERLKRSNESHSLMKLSLLYLFVWTTFNANYRAAVTVLKEKNYTT